MVTRIVAALIGALIGAAPATGQAVFPAIQFPAKTDGGHIIFSRLVPTKVAAAGIGVDTAISKLFVMDGDGANARPFIATADLTRFAEPHWSPKYDRLAFTSNYLSARSACMTDIFEARTDGTVRRLTGNDPAGLAPLGYGQVTGRVSPTAFDGSLTGRRGGEISVTAQGMEGVVVHPTLERNDFLLPKVLAGDKVWVKLWATDKVATLALVKVRPGEVTDVGVINLNEGAFSAGHASLAGAGTRIAAMGGLTKVVMAQGALGPVIGGTAEGFQPGLEKKIDGAESICLYDSQSGSLLASIDLGKTGYELAKDPALSPDGLTLACAWGRMAQENLALLPVAGVVANQPSPRVLVPGAMLMLQPGAPMVGCGSPCWSPDGKRLAFTRTIVLGDGTVSAGIWVVNADGSGLREVAAQGLEHLCCQPCFSPDGQNLAFTVLTGRVGPLKVEQILGSAFSLDVHKVDLATGRQTQLTRDGASCEPAWGP